MCKCVLVRCAKCFIGIHLNVQNESLTVNIDIEPSFLGLGPFHLLVGMNNRAWIYSLTDDGTTFIRDREYLGEYGSF